MWQKCNEKLGKMKTEKDQSIFLVRTGSDLNLTPSGCVIDPTGPCEHGKESGFSCKSDGEPWLVGDREDRDMSDIRKGLAKPSVAGRPGWGQVSSGSCRCGLGGLMVIRVWPVGHR